MTDENKQKFANNIDNVQKTASNTGALLTAVATVIGLVATFIKKE